MIHISYACIFSVLSCSSRSTGQHCRCRDMRISWKCTEWKLPSNSIVYLQNKLSKFAFDRLTLHSRDTFLSLHKFLRIRTHNLVIANAMLYCVNYRNTMGLSQYPHLVLATWECMYTTGISVQHCAQSNTHWYNSIVFKTPFSKVCIFRSPNGCCHVN